MLLKEKLGKQGEWLFKRRSYFPLFFVPVFLLGLRDFQYFERLHWDTFHHFWEAFSIGISVFGLFIRSITVGFIPKGSSGRNTKRLKAQELNTKGLYSILRHPLYLGNFFIMLGMVLFTEVFWLTLFSVLSFFLYYERIIIAEEEFLLKKFGHRYEEWASKTPAFIPEFKNWQKPDQPFSFKSLVGREYPTFSLTITSFSLIEIIGDMFVEKKLDHGAVFILAIALIFFLTLRILKKRFRLFSHRPTNKTF